MTDMEKNKSERNGYGQNSKKRVLKKDDGKIPDLR